ncbi:Phospho-2-dehydro-3-deoxyheptonate aldolase, Tyr-sensitive [Salmonella enterica subsp. enterica]|uniref:Phospho-2-dehydro-3-deoxyheptonate aldolase, Tyr-sensitive n=1 Tax=Salmonella enterica I TaxID=59201 RepID=A0A379WND4_SALET|nr:Phospho-2-dehydro-3-deoxyheptonate aldolase, Tyr-sensitive [Salmonella enterica subsp. enterica]SUH65105.1 Phospho-2-dehydro-3-deoxyheptonate aldolase, Tyr-sensitive [Salmonella enterica subsp. enterica serovar Madelia]
MQKDALNNVRITDEQVLMTPEQLKAAFPLSLAQEAQIAQSGESFLTLLPGAIRVCWWYAVLVLFTILKPLWNMPVDLKPLPQRSAIASIW